MRQVIFAFALLASISALAQDFKVVRGGCTPDVVGGEFATTRADAPRKYASLPPKIRDWDPNRIYRQLVILVAFKGDSTYFSMETPRETYDRMFNESGFNIEKRNCKGCVADYFRDQSNGMFNMQFDVFGPYDISLKAQPYESPKSSSRNYGRDAMIEATQMMLDENLNRDFSVYDWNGDGYVNQVIYVFAGYTGNAGKIGYGHLWPNTHYFSTAIITPDGLKIKNYTASAELWTSTSTLSCGIGTICHEFTHSLGLPDIYPTGGDDYSVVDEWDLMDGGNFTNYGWCPPNYSPHEKMLLGWLTPIELTDATTITGMKSVEDGGDVYMIKHTENEFYLLENRQWKGWDAGVPGKGLVVYHVNYDDGKWSSNSVNTKDGRPNYSLVHADNLDYNAWDDIVDTRDLSTYIESPRLHNRHLSTSPYPWTTDSTDFVNDCLTDSSTPASLMYNENDADSKYLSKAIKNVRMSDDGLISFDFEGYVQSAVTTLTQRKGTMTVVYDLGGHCLGSRLDSQRPGLYIVRYSDGTTKKVVKR